MTNLAELLGSLKTQQDYDRRIIAILDWTTTTVGAEGAALLGLGPAPSLAVTVQASRGSLTSAADRIAALWTRDSIPHVQGIVALPEGTVSRDCVLALPLDLANGSPWTVLVLHGADIDEKAKARKIELVLVSSLLGDDLEKEGMRRQIEHEKELAFILSGSDGSPLSALLPGLALLTDGLGIPLYVCDAQGRFLYASPSFLSNTAYPALSALAEAEGFPVDPKARADELETARSTGRVSNFPLSVRSGTGARLEMRDSMVSLGSSFLGVLYDVTDFMATKDALQIQEVLNDRILDGNRELQRTQDTAIRTLARLAEYRDAETGSHLMRICEYTRLLAIQVHQKGPYPFQITRKYCDEISTSSMLHDIGKVHISDSILLKRGTLDPGERETMKKHTIYGYEVLHKADRELGQQSFLTLAASIALSHHEHFDGTGYPHGQAGDQIHLSARISAIADVYDALTSARPYKEAWEHERAVEEIVAQRGSHFDPVLIDIFQDIHESFADVRRMFPGLTMKSGVIAIVGRPSAGKSTLLNALCGGKISIVSPVPQTTRNKVRGIFTTDQGQVVFIDTPGYHISEKKLNHYMIDLVTTALAEVDAVLYVVDGTRAFGAEERAILEALGKAARPIVACLNKSDASGSAWAEVRASITDALPGVPLLEISALGGAGLETLRERLFAVCPEGDLMYPSDYYTDQTPDFRISEIVREKAMLMTREEVPHSIYVRMEDLEMQNEGALLWARGFICVERESQKGILVGRAGERIKAITREAEQELAEIFPYPVKLDLRVKVDREWRKRDPLLRKMIR